MSHQEPELVSPDLESPAAATRGRRRTRDWSSDRVRETIVMVVLSVTAVLTAWTGFQSSKWGGEMSIAFSEASSARVEAARQQGVADAARQADLTVYGLYIEARATEDEQLAAYVQERFSVHFGEAFDAWLQLEGMAPDSPFVMDEYVPPGAEEAEIADAFADQRFADALTNNQRGDNYTLLTVLFALVLFFGAVSGRLNRPSSRWTMLGLSLGLLVVGAVILASYPIEV